MSSLYSNLLTKSRSNLFKYSMVAVLLLAVPLLILMFGEKVRVRTGTKIICTYGEVLKDSTRTEWVFKWQSDRYHVTYRRMLCQRHRTAEQLYARALKAVKAKDLRTAKDIFGEVAAIDPAFKDVGKQLQKLGVTPPPVPGSASGSNSSSNSGGQPGSDNKPGGSSQGGTTNPSGPLVSQLPKTVSGYRLTNDWGGDLGAGQTWVPTSKKDIQMLTIVLEQTGSDAGATSRIKMYKRSYSENARNLTIEGRPTYFGTDGRAFAVLLWHRGGVVYEMEVQTEGKPANARSPLTSIATAAF